MAGTDVGKIRIKIEADGDGLDRSIGNELDKAEGKVSGKVGAFAKRLGLAAGAAIGATAVKSVFDFTGFERQMNEVFTLMPGISGKAMQEMTGQVKDFSKEFGVLPDKVVPALYQALSAGVPPGNVFEFLETAQKAAKGGVTDLTTAVDGISSVVNAYGSEVLSATEASDLMFTAVRLGKCIRGDQRVILADGTYKRIDELEGGARVVAWDGRGLTPADAQWVYQGKKTTVTMRTRLGREIVTTWNHPYLVQRCRHGSDCQQHTCKREEWVKVKDLDEGDRVAVPTHIPVMGTEHVEEHESGLLGLWLADGTSQLGSPQITTMDYGDQLDVWASKWGCTVNAGQRTSKATTYRIVAGTRGGHHKNPVTEWLRSLKLGNCSASTKHLPDEVFRWDRESTATLLRWLFNGDGWLCNVQPQRSGYQLGFCSMSERLVRDISHLLLRFGIVGRIRRKGEAWVWETNRWHSIAAFVQHIGIDRPDAIDVLAHEPVKQRRRIGQLEFDPIVSIEEGEPEDVYDLIVPGPHNFIAEDVLAHNTNFEELSRSLFNVTPTTAALGVSFQDVTAALAAMTAQGVPTSVATTQLRQLFVELSKAGTDTSKTFEKLSGKSFKEFIAGGKTTQDALQLLETHAEKTGVGINDLFGSVEAGSAALALTGQGTKKFDEALAGMAESAGATQGAFDRMNTGIGPVFDRLKARGKVALIDLGDAIVNFAVQAADGFTGVESAGHNLATTLGAGLRVVVDFVRDNATPILAGLAVVLTAALVPALMAGAAAVAAFFSPVVLIVGAIALLVAGFVYAYQNFEGFRNIVDDVAGFLVDTVWPKIQQFAGFIADKFGELVGWVRENWGAIQEAIGHVINVVRGIIDRFIDAVQLAWKTWGDELMNIARIVWDQIKNVVETAINIVRGVIEAVLAVINGDWGKAWDAIKDILSTAWEFIKETLGNALRLMREAIEGAISGVVTFMGEVPGKILGALGDLGGLLVEAGKAIMRGLRDGIVAGFEAVKDFVGGIAGKIADLKGPLDYDKTLLTPAGKAIMGGLVAGLRAEEGRLVSQLAHITGMFENWDGALSVGGASIPSPTSSTSMLRSLDTAVSARPPSPTPASGGPVSLADETIARFAAAIAANPPQITTSAIAKGLRDSRRP